MRLKKEINVQVGERIKTAREAVRITQEQLAELIEVSPQFVSDAERGLVGVSLTTLKRICVFLGVSSDQILFGSGSRDRGTLLAEKCDGLTDAQYETLLGIVDRVVSIIHTKTEQ